MMIFFFQALNRVGLRVVLDVVYNHLHASGPFDRSSVLDKVVNLFLSLELLVIRLSRLKMNFLVSYF